MDVYGTGFNAFGQLGTTSDEPSEIERDCRSFELLGVQDLEILWAGWSEIIGKVQDAFKRLGRT
jgi:hypothetical protein